MQTKAHLILKAVLSICICTQRLNYYILPNILLTYLTMQSIHANYMGYHHQVRRKTASKNSFQPAPGECTKYILYIRQQEYEHVHSGSTAASSPAGHQPTIIHVNREYRPDKENRPPPFTMRIQMQTKKGKGKEDGKKEKGKTKGKLEEIKERPKKSQRHRSHAGRSWSAGR